MSTSIHRLLDEAFVGVTITDDVQDLKEELRGNLASRVAELEANGTDAATAATKAMAELGDIHELIADLDAEGGTSPRTSTTDAAAAAARNRVKPRPWFVVRAVLFSLIIAAGCTLVVLGALRVVTLPLAIAAAVVFALALGALVDDSLRQETSSHYRSPSARAAGWGLATIAFAAGLSLASLVFAGLEVTLLIAAVALVLAGIIGWVWLGVTQTNRLKPWALAIQRRHETEDYFAQHPAEAARFGLYTVVIWTLAITAFIVLSITVGFAWSWLAIVGGVVVFFLVLARMLFPAGMPEHK